MAKTTFEDGPEFNHPYTVDQVMGMLAASESFQELEKRAGVPGLLQASLDEQKRKEGEE